MSAAKFSLLAKVCVHSGNTVVSPALRNPGIENRQQLMQQTKDLLVSYSELYIGNRISDNVMKCHHCHSQ